MHLHTEGIPMAPASFALLTLTALFLMTETIQIIGNLVDGTEDVSTTEATRARC